MQAATTGEEASLASLYNVYEIISSGLMAALERSRPTSLHGAFITN